MSTAAPILEQRVEQQVDQQDQSPEQLQALLQCQRQAYGRDPMPSAEARKARMGLFKRMLGDHRDALMDALAADFSARSRHEMLLTEFAGCAQLTDYLSKRVKRWMKPEKRHLALHLQPGKARVYYQPVGVVGIMVPFNYPIYLAGGPLLCALAAGNHAMIKMPEATPRTSALFAELIAKTFEPGLVTVVNGGPATAAAFSALPFDHLLFTGAGSVGKHVMRAAAENLTPVTLELGGKSPVIVADDADLEDSARRICFGKSLNAGQTCVAPDYILVPRAKVDAFKAAYKQAFNTFYPRLNHNPDYTGVISDRHVQRLQGWLQEAQAQGAQVEPLTDEVIDDGSRRPVPCLVTNVNRDMTVMKEELFGPALPILPYDTLDQAIAYINEGDRPLALYYFGFDKRAQQQVLAQTHSGGVVFNEVIFHVAVDDLPFGGIGPSGMGHYHGREGFLTLSKAKSVLYKPRFNGTAPLYPPFGWLAGKVINFLNR